MPSLVCLTIEDPGAGVVATAGEGPAGDGQGLGVCREGARSDDRGACLAIGISGLN